MRCEWAPILALNWTEFDVQLDTLVADLARLPDAATLAQLACECGQALPPLAVTGLEFFNRGLYYRQHDLFEEQWMATAGPVRDLYRAILQVGVAYYQIERGNYRGALKMLQRSVQWLYLLPDSCQGIDVAKLRRDSYAVRGELQRLGARPLGGAGAQLAQEDQLADASFAQDITPEPVKHGVVIGLAAGLPPR